MFKQPKGVYLLAFVEMWNRFSHYGMRALLVLFMIKALAFSDVFAFGVYAVFCALVELGGVFGAYLADKILGLKRSILWGGWIIALGHASLAMEWFFPGLALLIVGSSLFTINITSLVGSFYEVGDEKRTSGFTLFYQAINIGALLATILCGLLAETLGWSYGFGLAAFGMVIGNIALMKYQHLLGGKGEAPSNATKSKQLLVIPLLLTLGVIATFSLIRQEFTLPSLPWIAGGLAVLIFRGLFKRKLGKMLIPLGIYFSVIILFFAAQEQIGSTLVVFADRMQTRSFLGLPMTSTFILALNPIIIIVFGSIASILYRRMKSPFLRLFIPFLLAAAAFCSIVLTPQLPYSGLMLIVSVISFAELLIGPIAYSMCSKISMQANDSRIMGLIPIGFALAATLGGGMSKLIAQSGYTYGFTILGLLMLASGINLGAILSRSKTKEVKNI